MLETNFLRTRTDPFWRHEPWCLQPIRRLIATDFPGVRMLETDSLHKGISGSKHRFVTMPPGRDKFDLLDEV